MTRRASRDDGRAADRGVHLKVGDVVAIIPTPDVSRLRCQRARCRRIGATIFGVPGDAADGTPREALCWCGLDCARRDGLRLPSRAPSPPPARSARHAE